MWELFRSGELVKFYLKAFTVKVNAYLNVAKELHVKGPTKNEREATSFQVAQSFSIASYFYV